VAWKTMARQARLAQVDGDEATDVAGKLQLV
jgi:hypothetical protein